MKAKDTIMTEEQHQKIVRAWSAQPLHDNIDYQELGDMLLQSQAGISFQAGWEQGWNDNKPYLPDSNEPWDSEQTVFNDGKQAGRQEVVDWMKENITWDWPNDELLFSSWLKEKVL